MRFWADHYFHSGLMHFSGGKPCQDYAISGELSDGAFAVISDGCSTGGHTDVGARLVSLSTASAIRNHHAVFRHEAVRTLPEIIDFRQRVVLLGTRQVLGLENRDLLATCLYVYLTPEGGFAHIRGDGVLALGYKDDTISIIRWQWADNMPFYPAYAEDSYSSFISAHGGDPGARVLKEENWFFSPQTGFQLVKELQHSLSEGISGLSVFFGEKLLRQDLSFIGIFSDGVAQVDNIEWKKAVTELFDFKSVAGEFVKRRMIRFVKDSYKIGKGPIDDIACAVVRVDNDPAEAAGQ